MARHVPCEPFADREDAGRRLGVALSHLAGERGLRVLALPRGGVPVAFEVARALGAPLDVLVVRKIGAPFQPEYAIGAIASGGVVLREPYAEEHPREFEAVLAAERRELARRERSYRGDRPALDLRGLTALLVDDGLATGATMSAAIRAARAAQARRIVVAVPVASIEAARRAETEADEAVVLMRPDPFGAVGAWYDRFDQVDDATVRRLLDAARPDALTAAVSGTP